MHFRTAFSSALLSLVFFAAFSSTASAQILKNTPFDPGTWNPNDWAQRPAAPTPPQPETLRVRNLGTDPIHFCYGDGRSIWGWATVQPGQTATRQVHLGAKHIAYVLIEKQGREVSLNRPSMYAPYHPSKRFKVRFRGNDQWDVDIEGVAKGRFHRNAFANLGLSGGKFYKLPVEKDGAHNININ